MLEIRGLTTTFRLGDSVTRAVADVDLDIAEGEFFVLLGPSGCGKTTMLRSIAGLERPERGSISINGSTVSDAAGRAFVAPERRPIAMVFQSYAIWPHMDVYENIAFPLREGVRRLSRDEVGGRVDEVLAMLGLEEMADRPVTTLSGGQQQRVALARALALQPKVLLMDEPLSNLDFKLQVRLRAQLKALMHRLGLTTIYVTHNQAEAMETGDRIAVMDHGRIVQMGSPREIYQRPADEFVARFIGDMNLLPASLVEAADGSAVLDSAIGRLRAVVPEAARLVPGDACFLGVRPEDVRLVNGKGAPPGTPDDNVVRGTVAAHQFVGEAVVYTIRVGEVPVQAKLHHSVELAAGDEISLHLPPEHCAAVAPARHGGQAYGEDEGLTREDAGDAV